jgi:class 3 adenylate cyclase/CheY-like chemotaxis protein
LLEKADSDSLSVAIFDFPPGTRVLVADDCVITQAMLQATLAEWGVEVTSVSDGLSALEILRSDDPPRLALLDWMMPGMNGPDICSRVRGRSKHYVYMLLLTSMGQKEHLIQGLEAGADDYMFKPFDPQELRARLIAGARVVGLHQTIEEKNKALERHSEFMRDVFGRYVTDEVADTLLKSPEGLTLGGEKRIVTILMSDLRGFTPLSEILDAQQVVGMLNRFLGRMVDVIFKHKGTIDEFIGDAILVIFGAPLAGDPKEDARRALACAIEMQQSMTELNMENRRLGMPDLAMGVGINSGEVVVGNIGSQRRMKYSVVGSPVNLTARIESFTLGGQILISDTTLRYVREVARVDGRLRVKVKGVDGPVSIFDVGGIGEPYNLYLPEVDYNIEAPTE